MRTVAASKAPDPAARDRALSLLGEVARGRRLDVAWESAAPKIPDLERGWVHEAVFGTIRMQGRIDHLLGLHLHRGIDSVPPPLLRLLRLGAYQLLRMDSVPDYAAVSETVTQARVSGGDRHAGLVNAVLRGLAREGAGEERFPRFEVDPAGYLSTWGSHPRWLVDRWLAHFGPETTREVVNAGNRIPELFARPLTLSPTDAADCLRAVGIDSSLGPEGSSSLRLPAGTDPTVVLAALPCVIQDSAASAVVDFVAPRPGDLVADLCAAPGGKGIGLTGLGARVVAADPSVGRLRRMRSAIQRLGLPERMVVARGEEPPFRPMDRVLVDAPCTGTGTLARHPDARWRLGPEDPARMAGVQLGILRGSASIVRPGGVLVYATCTLEEEENEGMVQRFLSEHTGFRIDAGNARLRIRPGPERTDGAFAVRLRRAG